jgi:hypothetical protein
LHDRTPTFFIVHEVSWRLTGPRFETAPALAPRLTDVLARIAQLEHDRALLLGLLEQALASLQDQHRSMGKETQELREMSLELERALLELRPFRL